MPRVTVGPKTGGGWQVTGEGQAYKTQAEAKQAARRQLTNTGGGELPSRGATAASGYRTPSGGQIHAVRRDRPMARTDRPDPQRFRAFIRRLNGPALWTSVRMNRFLQDGTSTERPPSNPAGRGGRVGGGRRRPRRVARPGPLHVADSRRGRLAGAP